MTATILPATNEADARTIAADIAEELDLPATVRYRPGIGWHVKVTAWA